MNNVLYKMYKATNGHQIIASHCRLNTYGCWVFSIVSLELIMWWSQDPVCGFDSSKQFPNTNLFSLYQCEQRFRDLLNAMHYINPRFTYLYLLTYSKHNWEVNHRHTVGEMTYQEDVQCHQEWYNSAVTCRHRQISTDGKMKFLCIKLATTVH